MRPEALDFREVIARQVAVPQWAVENGPSIARSFAFPDFAKAMDFANVVAQIAEDLNHHPDMAVGWGKLRLTISTHSAGGLTELDFEFAKLVDAAWALLAPPPAV